MWVALTFRCQGIKGEHDRIYFLVPLHTLVSVYSNNLLTQMLLRVITSAYYALVNVSNLHQDRDCWSSTGADLWYLEVDRKMAKTLNK